MDTMRKITWNLFLILVGSVICAVAVNSILIPKQFLAGGITGLAMLIHYGLPAIPLGMVYFALNIPIFIFGWMFVGRRFFLYSIAGMAIYSLAVLVPCSEMTVRDPLLNALTAGIITGIGSGILLRSLGSAGGMDRGVTVIHGQGGYSGQQQKVLYSIIPFQELARFKEIVRSIDTNAFVVINNTLEVMGHRIGNQPHW